MTREAAVTRWGAWPQRFWNRVEKSAGGCWIWKGTVSRGYGVITVPMSAMRVAHRVAYEMEVGPIPEGMQLDHLCRNTLCVNPAHLEPVTHHENQRRGLKGDLTTHCPKGHEYTPENTRRYRNHRYCRACHRDREQARRDRRAKGLGG
jgi:hypothetical protein